MPSTTAKSPSKIQQIEVGTTGRTFKDLNNIKVTKGTTYAITSKPIDGFTGEHNRPANLFCSNFKLNVPSNAKVTKIKVHYRFGKMGVCKNFVDGKEAPCEITPNDSTSSIFKNATKYPNLKAQIMVQKGNTTSQMAWKTVSIPKASESKFQTATFTRADGWSSTFANDLAVHVAFPINQNKNRGYVLVYYIAVTVDYVLPSYTCSIQGINNKKVYNRGQYHVKLTCSDKNLTKQGSPELNLSLPIGFTYRKVAGKTNGKVTKVSSRTLNWRPSMKGVNTASIELIFDVYVDFASSQSKASFTFSLAVQGTSTTKTHTATIYKELPPSSITETSDIETFTDEDSSIEIERPKWVILNEAFQLLFEFTEEEQEAYSDENGDMPVSFRAFDSTGTAASTWYYSNADNETLSQLSNSAWVVMDDDNSYTFNDYFKVITTYGAYTLQTYASIDGDLSAGRTEELIRELTIYVKPQENTLTIPNLSFFKLMSEETDRLGNNISYTVQSDMELTTSETYVRDWYKNFRIGVFNNPIEANLSSYYEYNDTETEFDGYFIIPTTYPLTNTTLTISTDNPIYITLDDVKYNLQSSMDYEMGDEYQVPVTFSTNGYNNVVLTITLEDSNDTELYSINYHINFNAEETTELREITTDTTDYTTLTLSEIFSNAGYWGETLIDVNTTENISTEFTYNKNYPVYILITADYPEGDIENNTLTFNEPCIIETTEYKTREINGLYPYPINNLIDAIETASITISPSNNSETIVFNELPLEDNYGTNAERAIRGVEITGEIEQSDTVIINARLKSPTGESRERNVIINNIEAETSDQETFTIGGNGDLWGFSTLDFTNLEDWEIELNIVNNLEDTDTTISFGAIQLILYIEEVDQQNVKCYIQGEDIAYYGAFITDLKIPEGLETDTDYLKVDGTDTNDAYRQNIKEKVITLKVDIGQSCDLETSTLSLREFTKLLVNDRDEYNRPIPKTIEFSHYPDVYWEYIMEEAFDSELELTTYHITAKLTIPAGTSYDTETTTTSNLGYVNGIASINPVIIVKPSDDNITIMETLSGQEFHIGYSGGWDDKIVEIDCEDRIVWLKTDEDDEDPINLNKYVDYNSDWFIIKGEYEFTGVNCVIRTVDYQERW